jgi:hypothetical protein
MSATVPLSRGPARLLRAIADGLDREALMVAAAIARMLDEEPIGECGPPDESHSPQQDCSEAAGSEKTARGPRWGQASGCGRPGANVRLHQRPHKASVCFPHSALLPDMGGGGCRENDQHQNAPQLRLFAAVA